MSISDDARQYIKDHKKELCEKFANLNDFPPVENPSAYFMAGSPGAGKTEYSKSLIELLHKKEPNRKIVRIDADEIRDWLPHYDHKNAIEVQGAAALGVEKLLDCVLHNGQDFILDATMADYEKSYKNIYRSLQKKREVAVIYIYQDPFIAWDFTKKREVLEGRRVPKETFIKAFFAAKVNISKLKDAFGGNIQLWLIIQDLKQGVEKTYFNIDNIDSYLKIKYTPQDLEDRLESQT